jgi:exodeoxyribonuclease V
VRHVELTEVVRQAAGNPIIQRATAVRRLGEDVKAPFPADLCQEHLVESDGGQVGIIHLPRDRFFKAAEMAVKAGSHNSVCVAAWTNNAVRYYNKQLRIAKYGQPAREQPFLAGEIVYTNEPVIVGKEILYPNNYALEIITAEAGEYEEVDGHHVKVRTADRPYETMRELFVPINWGMVTAASRKLARVARKFQKTMDPVPTPAQKIERGALWRKFYRFKEAMADLRPPFARTCHKSQGSTFETVFLDLSDIGKCKSRDDLRRLIYVGMTRASHNLIITGDIPANWYQRRAA